jgi:hypothetical protein
LWFEGQVKVTAIRFSPTSLSDRCEFEQRLRDYKDLENFLDRILIKRFFCHSRETGSPDSPENAGFLLPQERQEEVTEDFFNPGSRRPRPLAVDECVPSMDGRCRPTGA